MNKSEEDFVELMKENNYTVIRCSKGDYNQMNFNPRKLDDMNGFILIQTICNFIGEKGMPDFYCKKDEDEFFVELKWKNNKLSDEQQAKLCFLNDVIGIKSFVATINKLRK